MVVGILTEKPSAAKKFATALGGMQGTYNGEQYVITHALGHLFEFVDPHVMLNDPSLVDKYRVWELDNLPWDPKDLNWKLAVIDSAKSVAADVKRTLLSCAEIVIATDVDPTGEGGMIAANALLELGLAPQILSRMYFTDEAAPSLQKAFTSRKSLSSLDDFDEYKKARYRSQFDLLSMQFTRVATKMAHQSGQDTVLRQGRLKSAMVKLVGDQLKEYNDYVKKPFFQNRFRDENDVMYTWADEPRFDQKSQVPASYSPSAVVLDGKATKRTAPPRLLDLAALASMLVGKGVKAKVTLATYQKMYEAQIVSYPRTEDKTITPEQFTELVPLVDAIAGVVGVDTAVLTHRQARGTHVKSQGAHGANRPGVKVPSSLDEVETAFGTPGRLIYETLAKNFLAMVAEDYVYEQQKGHVEKYPNFTGIANVPVSAGWKQVFDPNAGEDSTDDNADADGADNSKGLGSQAEPFVFEGANKRAEHPTMTWLMKQLEKRDVGTGATRTSTYSEITSATAKYPLLVEKGRKITLAKSGELSWRLLPNTHIGDLAMTEKVYANMKAIAEGTANADDCLAVVADLVRDDIVTMQKNAAIMRADMGLTEGEVGAKERVSGVWVKTGAEVSFNRVWSGHRFTDAEVDALLAGKTIQFPATSTEGKAYDVFGDLDSGTFKGRSYVGFHKRGFGHCDAQGNALPPESWCKHLFTPDEIADLASGKGVEADDFISKKGNKFQCVVFFKEEKKGEGKKIVPNFDSPLSTPPASWCGVAFTDDERAALAAGKSVARKGFISSKGKKFNASVTWKDEGGKKKLVPSFN